MQIKIASHATIIQKPARQAIGRLGTGQSAQIVANAYNVNVRTLFLLSSNIDITPPTPPTAPTIARAVVVPESPHHGKIALFCANICKDRFTTTTETARHATGTQQRPISADTVRCRLDSNNNHSRRPALGPILTNRHQQVRLQWATVCQHWRYQQWRIVLFSDESRFCISTADGRVRVWRRIGERYADACVMERNSWGGQSILVWGAIGISHKAGPVIFPNTGPGRGNGVTALRYISQVRQALFWPSPASRSSRTMSAPTLSVPPGIFSSSTTSESCHGLPSVRI